MSGEPVLSDFPKLESPFIRRNFPCENRKELQDFQKKSGLRASLDGLVYLITPEVNPGFEWVFDDAETFAVEKLNGTNVKVRIKDMRIEVVQNRLNAPIDLLKVQKGVVHFAEGVLFAVDQGYITQDGEYAGELIGPKVQGNPYNLARHEWQPFDRLVGSAQYKSFQKYPRTFDNLCAWFTDHLRSLHYGKRHKVEISQSIFAEGVVFYNLKRKAEGKSPWMSKMRRDMVRQVYEKEGLKIGTEPVAGGEEKD